MASVRVGDGLPDVGGRETPAERAPRTFTEPGALRASPATAEAGDTTRPKPEAQAGSVPGSVNGRGEDLTTALSALHLRITDNCCPISGLTGAELAEHVEGIARVVVVAKGWDRIRAEYGDVRAEARQRAKRPCLMCERPTSALSQICTRSDCPWEYV